MALYKFMSSKYLDAFLDGEVRCQSLAFYQRHEAQGTIGDKHEAMRVFTPAAGLEIHKTASNSRLNLRGTFISEIAANDIFVFCVSRKQVDPKTIDENYDVTVEIKNVRKFTRRLRTAVQSIPGDIALLSRPVSYYDDSEPPGAAWALPDVIATSKRACFIPQTEHRFVIAPRKLMAFGSTTQKIQVGEPAQNEAAPIAEPLTVHIGNIKDICHVISNLVT